MVSGDTAPALTVLLAGAECRFSCVFCDLWRHTLDGPTPPGALPEQLRQALEAAGDPPRDTTIKLYNASNFFDRRAVPPEDDEAIARIVQPFARVVVECHPRLVGRRCHEFSHRLAGRLEVAMGLETVHPEALPRLNKASSLADFDRAAVELTRAGIGLRAFVLVGAPFVPPEETVEWAVRSAAHAVDRGASHVTLIPVRGGNGALEELTRAGDFVQAGMRQLEEALDRAVALPGAVVTADLWDVERLATCGECSKRRAERLARTNLTGLAQPPVPCARCHEPNGSP